jgi:hypothetical protein
MATIDETIDEVKARWREETGEPSSMGPQDIMLLKNMSGLSIIMHAFYMAIDSQEPEDIMEAAQMMYRTRERADKTFPIVPQDMDALGHCPVCITDGKEEGQRCTHRNLVRTALLLMALLRHYPEPDMDVGQDVAEAL